MNETRQLNLEPESLERLARLCGPFDSNLRQMEKDLGVEIRNRGHHFQVTGQTPPVTAAVEALSALYESTAAVEPSAEDVHLAVRETLAENSDGQSAGIRTRGVTIRPRGVNQAHYLQNILDFDLNFGIGPAGTGKTYLAVAAAVRALEHGAVRRLILVRPAVEAGERLGFLPGDLAQKIDPYLRPLYDALYEMLGYDRVARYVERAVIEVAPLAYMRGRTLNEAFVILDEAQNTTAEQMKMFLTRIGFGTTAVVTGDITQVDLPQSTRSGLRHAMRVLEGVDGVSVVHFSSGDVVRHPLVQRIVEAYARHENDAAD